MTITIEIPPALAARLVMEARGKGVSVAEVVKAYLYNGPPAPDPEQVSAGQVGQALDEAADLIPEGIPPLSDEAMSRESIYSREDDWNL